jgi:hypothetical protein
LPLLMSAVQLGASNRRARSPCAVTMTMMTVIITCSSKTATTGLLIKRKTRETGGCETPGYGSPS